MAKRPIMRAFTAFLCLTMVGCNAVGPRTIPVARANYNEAIVRSQDEQLFLNLIRLRYRDTPFFVRITDVTARYNVSYNARANVGGIDESTRTMSRNQSGNVVTTDPATNARFTDVASSAASSFAKDSTNFGASAGVTFTESPTVSYQPLQGDQYVTQLLTPIPHQNLSLLAQSGWDIEQLMLLCVQSINGIFNAPSASGPTPTEPPRYKEFHEITELVHRLQVERAIELGVTAEGDAVFRFFSEDVDPAIVADAKAALRMPEDTNEVRTSQNRDPAGPWMRTRSMLGVLYLVSTAVDVPESHYEMGWVPRTYNGDGHEFDWSAVTEKLISIQSQVTPPDDAYVRVKYRGTWFYIANDDLNSKSTFNLLSLLQSLQSGNMKIIAPIKTIPVF